MDTWERMALLVLAVLIVTPAYWLLRVGIQIGARRAVNDIVRGFRQSVPEKKGDDVLDDEVNLAQAMKVSGWYPLMGSGGWSVRAEMEIEKVGRLLGSIGYDTGHHAANKERDSFYPEEGEADVRMKRDQLERIALLADDGYWLNVDPRYDSLRSRQRFSKSEAEIAGSILDTFDRRIGLFTETDEEKEQRFTRYEDRIKSIVWFYR